MTRKQRWLAVGGAAAIIIIVGAAMSGADTTTPASADAAARTTTEAAAPVATEAPAPPSTTEAPGSVLAACTEWAMTHVRVSTLVAPPQLLVDSMGAVDLTGASAGADLWASNLTEAWDLHVTNGVPAGAPAELGVIHDGWGMVIADLIDVERRLSTAIATVDADELNAATDDLLATSADIRELTALVEPAPVCG
jgi:hypothetical protein